MSCATTLASIKPISQQRVIDLVQAGGIDVTPWSITETGKEVENPAANPDYCYEWSFGGGSEPTACSRPDLAATFTDHELADGVHYAYRFRREGTVSGFNMGKQMQGIWHVAGDEFCWTLRRRDAEEECFDVERRGPAIRLVRDGVPVFIATLIPIKQSFKEVPR